MISCKLASSSSGGPSHFRKTTQALKLLSFHHPIGHIQPQQLHRCGANTRERKQEIDFEARRDGYSGLIYEASEDRILPLQTRLAGPGAAFTALGINLLLWFGGLIVWRLGSTLITRRRRAIRDSIPI